MSEISIKIKEDDGYNLKTVIIIFNDYVLCQLNKDKGVNNIEIEFFNEVAFKCNNFKIKMPLSTFKKALDDAKMILIEA